jgi:hypothetical protein
MELDDLKGAWTDAGLTAGGASLDELIPRLQRLRRRIFWRDAREIAAAAVVFAFFAWSWRLWSGRLQVPGDLLVARIGAGVILASLLLIVAVLLWARRPRASPGASMGEHLRVEVTHIERQVSILQHVAWWYVGPCTIGVNLVVAGLTSAHSAFAIRYAVITLVIGVFLVWLNRRAAHKLRPLRDSLQRGLDAIREPETNR